MTNVDGSLTWFRGLPSAVTELHEVVLTLPLKAGSTVYKGQVLAMDQDNNQETSPVAGTSEKGDTNGYVLPVADLTATICGVCLANVDDSDTTAANYGKRTVPVLLKGITLMRCIVNATGTGDGYEIPIKVGNPALVGGGTGITGADTVTGFTTLTNGAYAIAAGSTDGSSNKIIGWFLDSQDGHATSHTISDNTTTISASQAQSPNTWVRVYVDMFAAHSGTIVTLSI